MLTTILHESAHACAAFALGVRSTLFNYSADLDLTPMQAVSHAPALIRIAGPSVCLVVGILCRIAFSRARGAGALPLLYLSVFGMGTFFGNLMSTAFVGDFSVVATTLGLPMTARAAIAAAGAVSVAALHFWAGRRLVEWTPAQAGRVAAAIGIVVLPVVLGTAAVILVNQPMPRASVNARVAEAGFWLFAALGALLRGRDYRGRTGNLALSWADGALTLLAIIAVRLIARGIAFIP